VLGVVQRPGSLAGVLVIGGCMVVLLLPRSACRRWPRRVLPVLCCRLQPGGALPASRSLLHLELVGDDGPSPRHTTFLKAPAWLEPVDGGLEEPSPRLARGSSISSVSAGPSPQHPAGRPRPMRPRQRRPAGRPLLSLPRATRRRRPPVDARSGDEGLPLMRGPVATASPRCMDRRRWPPPDARPSGDGLSSMCSPAATDSLRFVPRWWSSPMRGRRRRPPPLGGVALVPDARPTARAPPLGGVAPVGG
jgi:hypothetical protein